MKRLVALPRHAKALLMVFADAVLLPLMVWFAVCLRYGEWRIPQMLELLGYMSLPVIALPLFLRAGLYRAVVRYIAERAVLMMLAAVSVVVMIYAGVTLLAHVWMIPRSAFLILWLLVAFYMLASRFAVRQILRSQENASRRRVLIYGAGDAGRQLANALRHSPEFWPVAFVDDSPRLYGLEIGSLLVYAPDEIPRLLQQKRIELVLLAIPSASKDRIVEIINVLEPLAVQVKVVPGMAELVSGELGEGAFRDVDIDELLGREAVPPVATLLAANIKDKVVMVTGAGGSIGSELCRQIVRHQPVLLVLYEMSEFALYSIDQELAKAGVACDIVPVLGSVQNGVRVSAIMQRYGVQTVYHAAAYKHVPMVEFNITEGVLNNTFGTLATAQAALLNGVETFVLVSTDKAVRPTNVMGATKRMAELVLQALADAHKDKTRFCMVRFGNVLGSSGSVVPLFKRQLSAGGPITVTHPEITRYFMTIPEAAQLVIQAGAMGASGEVFVLDMGKPVKITDLARRLIHLSGHSIRDSGNPSGDIEIQFTGLRPGEKLYEELLIGGDVSGTSHPKIMKAREGFLVQAEMEDVLARLAKGCANSDFPEIIAILHQCVADFKPEKVIKDHLYDSEA